MSNGLIAFHREIRQMPPQLDLLVAGKAKRVSAEDVSRALRGARPGSIRTHAVRVNGVLFPVKEAWAMVSGLDLLDFNTNQARIWLRKLGFDVVRVSGKGA